MNINPVKTSVRINKVQTAITNNPELNAKVDSRVEKAKSNLSPEQLAKLQEIHTNVETKKGEMSAAVEARKAEFLAGLSPEQLAKLEAGKAKLSEVKTKVSNTTDALKAEFQARIAQAKANLTPEQQAKIDSVKAELVAKHEANVNTRMDRRETRGN